MCLPETNVYLDRCPEGETLHKPNCFVCIIWTCMNPWVTTSVPVLKTTCFSYSNRRCCHIRLFHPYLTVRSPPLIILWHSMRGGFGHALLTLHGHCHVGVIGLWWTICYPTGTRVSSPFWGTWFIIRLCSSWGWAVISRKVPGSVGFLSRFDHFVQTHSAPINRRLFSPNTTNLLHLWNRLNSEHSDSVPVFTNNNILHHPVSP